MVGRQGRGCSSEAYKQKDVTADLGPQTGSSEGLPALSFPWAVPFGAAPAPVLQNPPGRAGCGERRELRGLVSGEVGASAVPVTVGRQGPVRRPRVAGLPWRTSLAWGLSPHSKPPAGRCRATCAWRAHRASGPGRMLHMPAPRTPCSAVLGVALHSGVLTRIKILVCSVCLTALQT